MIRRDRLAPAAVALLALAATVTSIGHDFTFDDIYVVRNNDRVHALGNIWKLFGQTYWPPQLGGDGYRPLVMTLFTLQHVAGGGAPWVLHLGNILLAMATALAVYWCARAVLPRGGAWVAAALFAVHPVHVEVTGNLVGQSELLVALFLSLAIGHYIRVRRRGLLGPRDAAIVLGLFALGLLSKEHAIVLPALLVAAEATVIRDRHWKLFAAESRDARLLALSFGLVIAVYLYVRSIVQTDLAGFVPFPVFRFLKMTAFDRIAMMMTEIPRVAQLLVFPTRLSGDYSPGEVVIPQGLELVELPGVIICAGVLALAIVLRKRAPVASFGLWWVMLSYLPVSNLLIPAGFITAERTLFFPSVGVVLIAGSLFEWLRAQPRVAPRRAALVTVAALVTLGLARSIDRQRVWKNNDVFFDQLVRDVPKSYRAHFLRGRQVGGAHTKLRETELEYKRAIRLFPYDLSMTLVIASDYQRAGMCEPAVALLRWSYSVEPDITDGRFQYVDCLAKMGLWQESREAALEGLRYVGVSQSKGLRRQVASADSALGRRQWRKPAPQ
jgi:protein O-mannosyl-transferase